MRRIREGVPGEPMNGHHGVLKTAGAAKPPGVPNPCPSATEIQYLAPVQR